jgi:hypothetical protein
VSTALARAVLVLVGCSALVAGCGSGRDSMLVRERFESVQVPHRIAGRTSQAGQVVRNDCTISAVYKVREATGTAFLTQSEVVHLRLRVPREGTAYELECLGPLLVELPAAASKVEATAHDLAGGGRQSLRVVAGARSVRLPPGRLVRTATGKQLVLVQWPRRPGGAYDNFRVELSFRAPRVPLIRERVVYTAAVACRGSVYLQPVVPLADDLGFVNAFTAADGKPFDFILPRLAAGIASHGEETRTLACGSSR